MDPLTPAQILRGYYHQVVHGCDNLLPCDTVTCLKYGNFTQSPYTPTEAALRAITLARTYESQWGLCQALPPIIFFPDIPHYCHQFESIISNLNNNIAVHPHLCEHIFSKVLLDRNYFIYLFRTHDSFEIGESLDLPEPDLLSLLSATQSHPDLFSPYKEGFVETLNQIYCARRVTYHDVRGLVLALCFPALLKDDGVSQSFLYLIGYISQCNSPGPEFFYAALARMPALLAIALEVTESNLAKYLEGMDHKTVIELQRYFSRPSECTTQLAAFLRHLRRTSLRTADPIPPDRFVNQDLTFCICLVHTGEALAREPYSHLTVFFPPSIKARVLRKVLEQSVRRTEPQRSFKVVVSRSGIRQEAIRQIVNARGPEMLRPLVVEFQDELGVDAGGVSQEFFGLLCGAFIAPECKMLVRLPSGEFWLNGKAVESEVDFEALGRIIGLTLYNAVTLPIRFSVLMYKKLCGMEVTFEDLRFFDVEIFERFIELRAMREVGENVEEVGLVFSQGDSELIEGGLNRNVNNENLEEYLVAYKEYVLNKAVEVQFAALQRGFRSVVDHELLPKILEYDELDLIVSGVDELDWDVFKRRTSYENGYNVGSPVIVWFWNVFEEFDDVNKRKFMEFVTGYERFPCDGVNMRIQRVGDATKLPVAHTCFFILSLPDYPDQQALREKLLIAIEYTKGFALK